MAVLPLFFGAWFLSLGSFVEAQDVDNWRIPFAAGEEARRLGDITGYALKMSAAAELLPQSHPSRPLVQYHAALIQSY